MAGHDEDPAKAAMGTPLERIMKMGAAMLEAVRAFKPPSSDGKKFEIRLGQLTPKPQPPLSVSGPPCLMSLLHSWLWVQSILRLPAAIPRSQLLEL